MEFKDRLVSLREEKGWTKKETAKRIGISIGAYANYEYGNREPNQDITKKIASVFDIPVSLLLDDSVKNYSEFLQALEDLTDFTIDKLDKNEKLLNQEYIKAFKKLNDTGREMLFKYSDFLSEQEEYKGINNIKIEIGDPEQD
ncbi:MAG: helix-turn-helix transcriptional regulator [Vagococcus sp.]|jgi:transcriptional regulator with XRE-family HTH domain|nr:helix-turn-helix transcriptional regulator [Vagococcus sp.]